MPRGVRLPIAATCTRGGSVTTVTVTGHERRLASVLARARRQVSAATAKASGSRRGDVAQRTPRPRRGVDREPSCHHDHTSSVTNGRKGRTGGAGSTARAAARLADRRSSPCRRKRPLILRGTDREPEERSCAGEAGVVVGSRRWWPRRRGRQVGEHRPSRAGDERRVTGGAAPHPGRGRSVALSGLWASTDLELALVEGVGAYPLRPSSTESAPCSRFERRPVALRLRHLLRSGSSTNPRWRCCATAASRARGGSAPL
jgi:hypothetical protein